MTRPPLEPRRSPPRKPGIDVSAVVVNYNGRELLRTCLQALRVALDASGAATEIVVIENASTDGSREMLAADFAEVRVIASDVNLGFAGASQLSIAEADGEWLFFVNNDALTDRDAISALLAEARRHADVGALAAQMRFADRPEIVNSAGLVIDCLGTAIDVGIGTLATSQPSQPTEVFGTSAGAALYRRAMLEQIGGFDASFFMYLEDADVAWRARAHGWRCLQVPGAVVLHEHSRSAGHRSDFKYFHVGRNRVRMLAKNATAGQLARYGPLIVLYDLAYCAYALAVDRSSAPLRGRVTGLREWSRYRSRGAPRRPVVLAAPHGLRAALRRTAAVGPVKERA
jgi:GT2 family glycosyltransferase